MNIWDVMLIAVIAAALALAIRYLLNQRKRNSCGCCPYAGSCPRAGRPSDCEQGHV